MDSQAIRSFNLFGETGEMPDVIHVETIEKRSRLHDWEFAPHRHGRLHQVIAIERGGGVARIEGTAHALAEGVLINVPVGVVHGFTFQPGTVGRVVTLLAELRDELLAADQALPGLLTRPAVVPAPAASWPVLAGIETEFEGRSYARAQVLRSLTGVLLGLVARAVAGAEGAAGAAPPPQVRRFLDLVEKGFASGAKVADYAARLGVSATHLSRLCREATGQPASRLIAERLLREARRNLAFTTLPVSTIAYELGYDDPAYFSRVFQRETGESPSAFRARVGRG
ncbi:helix-turn-helix domain-containing protein [Mesobacterium pallidum]|uniref:helix-turn-helix domain-containing protein n=1 Tax=Mesobacterium pallidum TaxID=2872037 RepID=UPI001EE15D8C|nr:helix-turn-helix domain-containing protein [Mesobacterium pallidum]